MFNHSRKDEPQSLQAIPLKANLVLKVVLCVLFIIGLRVWHLAVIQHEKRKEEAFSPRRRVLLEPAPRGTIRDRNNLILATNKLEYRVAIVYSQFRDVPAWVTVKEKDGTKRRRYLRREYIHKLALLLADILEVDATRLEDIIHSHASLNNTIPLVLRQGLSEEGYFRLKALEKDWVGIQVQRVPKRHYPHGKVGCDVVGYLGPISKEKYSALIAEIGALSEYVSRKEQGEDPDLPTAISSFSEAKARLLELQEKAYAINDSVGILGIEAGFEEELRG
jgi:cell division protein FtsI/penicillin-binding protein 2